MQADDSPRRDRPGGAAPPGSVGPRRVGAFASVVRCGNPGPLSLDGTNTWLLGPLGGPAVLVDPGPAGYGAHLDAVTGLAPPSSIELTLITHGHEDHAGAVDGIARLTDAPVRAFSAEHCRGGRPLEHGETIEVGGLRVTVLHTPGHTPDSVCLLVEAGAERVVLTGDTLLGVGTPVLADRPDALRDYLSSLTLLEGVGTASALPGHGPEHDDLGTLVRGCRAHREERLAQVRAQLRARGLAAGDADAASLVPGVYPEIGDDLVEAATSSLRAQLFHLATLDASSGAGVRFEPGGQPLRLLEGRREDSNRPPSPTAHEAAGPLLIRSCGWASRGPRR